MPVVLLVAAAAILGGVVIVAIGRGGELARFPADVSPFDAEIVTAADVVLLRPPAALFGYNRQVADDALSAIARTITERDVEIATLRRQLADLRAQPEPGTAAGPRAASDSWPGPDPRPPPTGGSQAPPLTGRRQARPPTGRSQASSPSLPPQGWSAWDPPAPAPGPDPDAAGDLR